jgi:hypothetical protein
MGFWRGTGARAAEGHGVTGVKVVTGELHRVQRGRRKTFVPKAPPAPMRRPARVAVMLVVAHQIQRAIDRRELAGQAEAARRLGLTRARLTELLDLTLLAPDLQEKLIFEESIGSTPLLPERALRSVGRVRSWEGQRVLHGKVLVERNSSSGRNKHILRTYDPS